MRVYTGRELKVLKAVGLPGVNPLPAVDALCMYVSEWQMVTWEKQIEIR